MTLDDISAAACDEAGVHARYDHCRKKGSSVIRGRVVVLACCYLNLPKMAIASFYGWIYENDEERGRSRRSVTRAYDVHMDRLVASDKDRAAIRRLVLRLKLDPAPLDELIGRFRRQERLGPDELAKNGKGPVPIDPVHGLLGKTAVR